MPTQTSPAITHPIFEIARTVLRCAKPDFLETLPNLNFTHCTISKYLTGDALPTHKDDESIHKHFHILSVSFGCSATSQMGGSDYILHHGDAIIFNGLMPHNICAIKGSERINFTFRAWHK